MFSEVCWAKEQVCVGFQICDPNSFRAEGGGGFTIYENIIGINAKKTRTFNIALCQSVK